MMELDFDETSNLRKKQTKSSAIFVGSGGGEFFNGFIVRIDEMDNLKLNAKLYAR